MDRSLDGSSVFADCDRSDRTFWTARTDRGLPWPTSPSPEQPAHLSPTSMVYRPRGRYLHTVLLSSLVVPGVDQLDTGVGEACSIPGCQKATGCRQTAAICASKPPIVRPVRERRVRQEGDAQPMTARLGIVLASSETFSVCRAIPRESLPHVRARGAGGFPRRLGRSRRLDHDSSDRAPRALGEI
jgi:hypothetical protein